MPRKIQAFVKPERILTSYDFIDIARGVSVVEFYGGKISGATLGVSEYATSNVKFWSSEIWSEGIIAEPGITKDFDVSFSFPKVVEGVIVCNVPTGLDCDGNARTVWSEVEVYHVDKAGGTTLLGEGQTDTYTSPATVGRFYRMLTCHIPDVKQRFAPGETIRFKVKVYIRGGGGSLPRLGHDPKNRAFSATGDTDVELDAPSQLTFQVPFKIFI